MIINILFRVFNYYNKVNQIYNNLMNYTKDIIYKIINKELFVKKDNLLTDIHKNNIIKEEDIKVYYLCANCNKDIIGDIYCYKDKCYCSEECRDNNIY